MVAGITYPCGTTALAERLHSLKVANAYGAVVYGSDNNGGLRLSRSSRGSRVRGTGQRDGRNIGCGDPPGWPWERRRELPNSPPIIITTGSGGGGLLVYQAGGSSTSSWRCLKPEMLSGVVTVTVVFQFGAGPLKRGGCSGVGLAGQRSAGHLVQCAPSGSSPPSHRA